MTTVEWVLSAAFAFDVVSRLVGWHLMKKAQRDWDAGHAAFAESVAALQLSNAELVKTVREFEASVASSGGQ